MDKFWKVCPAEQVDDPDGWCTAYAPTAREAAIEHYKYLNERDGHVERMDLVVTPEGGGGHRTFTVRAAQVWTYAAEETISEAAHA